MSATIDLTPLVWEILTNPHGICSFSYYSEGIEYSSAEIKNIEHGVIYVDAENVRQKPYKCVSVAYSNVIRRLKPTVASNRSTADNHARTQNNNMCSTPIYQSSFVP